MGPCYTRVPPMLDAVLFPPTASAPARAAVGRPSICGNTHDSLSKDLLGVLHGVAVFVSAKSKDPRHRIALAAGRPPLAAPTDRALPRWSRPKTVRPCFA